jgi:hypothetical protein
MAVDNPLTLASTASRPDTTGDQGPEKRAENSHIWQREEHEHYVEPEWCSRRLFEVESFEGGIFDPCCGFGTIPEAASAANYPVSAHDIVNRGYAYSACEADFLKTDESPQANIVCNPPFDIFREFAAHALALPGIRKVAMIWLVRTLPAARWLQQTPLKTIYLLTPRPSMPPGHVIARGEKPGGGKQDFCWLVWEKGFYGEPSIKWLHRDGGAADV